MRSLQFWWINYVYAINKREVKQSANRFLWHFHWNRTHFGCWKYQAKRNHWQKWFIHLILLLYVMIRFTSWNRLNWNHIHRLNVAQHRKFKSTQQQSTFETMIWQSPVSLRIMLTFCGIPSCEIFNGNIQLNFTNRLSILCYLTATTNWHFLIKHFTHIKPLNQMFEQSARILIQMLITLSSVWFEGFSNSPRPMCCAATISAANVEIIARHSWFLLRQ